MMKRTRLREFSSDDVFTVDVVRGKDMLETFGIFASSIAITDGLI
jgi:hypothetical protein